ncbi:MAG: hypothetical protein H0Z29_03270 [Candidatus Marinimicrobia bacterium]|nr:hypothetical protein [Candidatus Neomarinimicrobiota bacterium]
MKVQNKFAEQNIEIQKRIEDLKLKKASKEFEGLFLSYVIKAMEKTLPEGGIVGDKNNLVSMLFSSMMGKAIAENGGVGLSKVIYRALKKKGEVENMEMIKTESYLDGLDLIRSKIRLLENDDE